MRQKKVKTAHGYSKKTSAAGRLIMAVILIELSFVPSSPFSFVDPLEALAADTSASTSSHRHKLIRPRTSSASSSGSTKERRWHRWKGNRSSYQATGSSSSASSSGSTNTGSRSTESGDTGINAGAPSTTSNQGTSAPAQALVLNRTSLTFAATQGASNPAAQTVSITNSGNGTLAWVASGDAAWLTLSPASGSGNGAVTASVNTAGLAAGTYNASIALTATGATNTPQTVPVTLTVGALAASSVTLMWDPVTVSDLAGYKVYRSTTASVYSAPIATIPATPGTAANHVSNGLQTGSTYYWRITAYDTSGLESEPSAEVSKSVY